MNVSIYSNKRATVKKGQFAKFPYVPYPLVYISDIKGSTIYFQEFRFKDGISLSQCSINKVQVKEFKVLPEDFKPLPEILKAVQEFTKQPEPKKAQSLQASLF